MVGDLPPGSYVIRVRAAAFAEREFPPLTLQVGQNAEVKLGSRGGAQREGGGPADALSVQDLTSVVGGVLAATGSSTCR